MGATKGNRFWELRSRHGRKTLFETPQLLWEAACEYFAWCEDNPLIEIDFKGKDAERVEIPKMRAMTMQGLCLFLDCNVVYFNHFETELKKREDELSKDFCKIVARIRETIYQQKFTGAAAGFLNPNIIARDLGLTEKKEVEHSGYMTNTIITKEEAKKIASDLDEIV
jgi:hypothetical protein